MRLGPELAGRYAVEQTGKCETLSKPRSKAISVSGDRDSASNWRARSSLSRLWMAAGVSCSCATNSRSSWRRGQADAPGQFGDLQAAVAAVLHRDQSRLQPRVVAGDGQGFAHLDARGAARLVDLKDVQALRSA